LDSATQHPRAPLKLQFMASETALFQRLLAHAAYTARLARLAGVTGGKHR
jgi:hypothetical protein